MAVVLEGGCRVFGLKEGEAVSRDGLTVWRHVGRERGARAISLSVLEVASGSRPAWRNPECDDVFFVLAGDGELVLSGQLHRIGPSDGVFVRPGASVAVRNPGPVSLILLDSRCPDPGPDLLFEAAVPFSSDVAPRVLSPVVRFEDQPTDRAGDGRWFRVLVDAKMGCEQTTQFVGFIPPGRAPEHFHEYEEVVCILEGEGRFWSGASCAPVAPGSCLYLPRLQPHCLENTGSEPLRLYGLFYPAGSPAVRYQPGGGSD